MFYEGGDIKFIVESFKCLGYCYNKSSRLNSYSRIGEYSFTINANGFKKIHQEKYPNYNIEEEETLWVNRKEKFESDLKNYSKNLVKQDEKRKRDIEKMTEINWPLLIGITLLSILTAMSV